MKIKKISICLLILIWLCIFPLSACADKKNYGGIVMEPEAPEQAPYRLEMLDAGELPVATFIPPTPAHSAGFTQMPGLINDTYYKLAADAGINLIMGHFESDQNIRANMDMCAKYDMGYLVHTDSMGFYRMEDGNIVCYDEYTTEEQNDVKQAFLSRISEFSSHPAFAGVHFVDEPGVEEFPGIAAAKEIFKQEYPDKMFYVNLMSMRSTSECLQFGADHGISPDISADDPNLITGSASDRYDYHVSQFVDVVSPDLLCFDLYPFTDPGMVIPGHYIQNLNIIRKYAQNNDLQFWNFMQVSQYAGVSADLRVPTINEIAWEFNTSLA